jgi:hypothetical protein
MPLVGSQPIPNGLRRLLRYSPASLNLHNSRLFGGWRKPVFLAVNGRTVHAWPPLSIWVWGAPYQRVSKEIDIVALLLAG